MKKNKIKYLSYLLVLVMMFELVACGSKQSGDSRKKSKAAPAAPKVSQTPVSMEALAAESPDPAAEVTEEAVQPPETESPVIETSAEPEEAAVENAAITELNQTMYAVRGLNVRSGDHAKTELIGSLETGQEVRVTGQSASSGWYRIEFNGQEGYVSNKYLQNEKPSEQQGGTNVREEAKEETAMDVAPNVAEPQRAQSQSGSAEQIINSAPLNPSRSGYEPLDTMLDNLFAALFTADMSTYEKVKACYDCLIQNCSYGMNEAIFEHIEDLFWGYGEEVSAYGILTGHVGVCDDYSAAFAAMTRAIGLDCRVVGGQTAKAGGGYTPHAWCVININGTEYVFDPQVEDNIAKGGTICYYRFCKRYDEVPEKYIVNE